MTSTPRQRIKQNLDQAMTHLTTLQGYLIANGEVNRELHPDITKQYEIVFAYFNEGMELLKTLRATY